jgi:hypothetical protein
MNWGYKIMFVIITFIIIMSGMIVLAYQQQNEMVDTNYYESEVNYQYIINASLRLNELTMDSLIVNNGTTLALTIPTKLIAGFQEGEIEFLKINDQNKDKKIKFKPDTTGLFIIDKATLSEGSYKSRIKWTSKSQTYYREQNIIVY